MKFTELDIPKVILKSLEEMGFEDMTPIQEATYEIISSGQDLCALAETGSGKTAACAIPLIQKIDPARNVIQALIIVPTRELCLQYVNDIRQLATGTGVVPAAVYGGVNKALQKAKLAHEAHILVATPGRLIDLMYDGVVEFPHVKCAILDEADELLKLGFIENVEFIISCIRQQHQTMLFSATMDEITQKLADKCLYNPQHVSLISSRSSPKSLEHQFIYTYPKQKNEEILKLLARNSVKQVIIFCNARYRVDTLFREIRRSVADIEYIHAGLSQEKRSSIFRRFKKGNLRCLIATDVAGRGLDFSNVSHVVNWDFPQGKELYTHRTGRAGRMGRKGIAFTLATNRDLAGIRALIHAKKIIPHWIGNDPLGQKDSPRRQNRRKKRC